MLLSSFSDGSIYLHVQRSSRPHHEMITALLIAMPNHCTSYNMVIRPTMLFREPPMANPVQELTSYNFFQSSNFWLDQFSDISENPMLIPDIIVCECARYSVRNDLALFLMLCHSNEDDNW
jgi:hypothetical protein